MSPRICEFPSPRVNYVFLYLQLWRVRTPWLGYQKCRPRRYPHKSPPSHIRLTQWDLYRILPTMFSFHKYQNKRLILTRISVLMLSYDLTLSWGLPYDLSRNICELTCDVGNPMFHGYQLGILSQLSIFFIF